jgi:hypothetical protein
MTRDITAVLQRAMARPFSAADATSLLSEVAAMLPASQIDWDAGAGESWARCIVGGDVVAYVGMQWPIIILSAAAGVVDASGSAETLAVDSTDAAVFRADRGVLAQFSIRPPSTGDFNPQGFSADDLVWLSV